MKVIVRMSAGLANRMFQYSYYLYLKEKGYNVLLDNLYKPSKWKMEDISWNAIFPNARVEQASVFDIYVLGGGYDIISKIRRHYFPFTTHVEMPEVFDLVAEKELQSNVYIAGAFQNANMVDDVKDQIYKVFGFSNFTDFKNQNLAVKIQSENSVAIHIRKGEDYLLRRDYQGTCSASYYQNAIAYIKSKINEPKFYIFSDNWDWVNKNIKGVSYIAVDWNPCIGWGNHFDMQLMSLFKHNIIANSTYSWWGAYLNRNDNKIVVCPKKWFNEEMQKYRNINSLIIPEKWISLE
ncbi:alpha-1,2-fucosyltransferase [Phocaeicola vulgatus]|uniref:Glycosyl transferase family 11 n=1 Tax=Phocaeicola vulgatus TaxID=821 RepID=A0A662ZYQ2_PHOVU|nr:alpha-1,2-fucosyltransferase [Phocaeicola vulgatus]MBD9346999.1 alpha-1,2-fucosyltransferase [Phocaeicola vulgatus]TSE48167.1 glycosyl transferase family 11 [Phocaeicola vulgatus]TSE52797.1 glycosyl transferase family 11 [Phocaeicola vulgatus]